MLSHVNQMLVMTKLTLGCLFIQKQGDLDDVLVEPVFITLIGSVGRRIDVTKPIFKIF